MLHDAATGLCAAWGLFQRTHALAQRQEEEHELQPSLLPAALPWAGLLASEAARWAQGGFPAVELCLLAIFFLARGLYHAWIASSTPEPGLEVELVYQLPVPLVAALALCSLLPWPALRTITHMFSLAAPASTWPLAMVFAAVTVIAVLYHVGQADDEGQYAVLQERFGPLLARNLWGALLLVFANAANQELEFRGLLQPAMAALAGLEPGQPLTTAAAWGRAAAAVAATNGLFALQHGSVFPCSARGTALMFAWGCGLGFLRCFSAGLLQPFAVHLSLDLALAALLARDERRRQERLKQGKASPPPVAPPGLHDGLMPGASGRRSRKQVLVHVLTA